MVVHNPTSKSITIKFKGVEYTVGGNDSLSGVPADAASYWKDRVHNFIEVSNEVPSKKEAVVPKEEEKSIEPAKGKK